MATVPRSATIQRHYPAKSLRQDIPPNLIATFFFGLDRFFGGPGQPPANLDWPQPRRSEHPTSTRTWTFGPAQIPSNIPLIPTNLDPRSPTFTRYYPAAQYRNDQPPNLALTTLSAAAPAIEPFIQTDWPDPKVTPSFYPTHSLSLLALAVGNPFTPVDFPSPRTREHPTSARTWIVQGLCLVGQDVQFGAVGMGKSYDYPLPRCPQSPPGNRGFVGNTFNIGSFNKEQIFGVGGPVYDYPVPKPPQYPIANRTWIYSPNLNLDPNLQGNRTFFGTGGPVYDYPLPRRPHYPVANRTWINSLNLNLFGQDQFFGIPGQPPANMNWPNPKRPVHVIANHPVPNMAALTLQPIVPPPPPPPQTWTDVSPKGGIWTKANTRSGTWTDENPNGGTWTKQ